MSKVVRLLDTDRIYGIYSDNSSLVGGTALIRWPISFIHGMKYILFIFYILSTFKVFGQTDTSSKGMTKTKDGIIYYSNELPLFQIDSCLNNLLSDIAQKDNNADYFGDQIGTKFYSLEAYYRQDYISLDLWPVRVSKSDYFDYYGAIKIGEDAVFLLRGDFGRNTLFHPSSKEPPIRVDLQRPEKRAAMDDIDKQLFELVLNPSLYGTFLDCTGLKIYMQIYIQAKLPDFEMKVDKKKREEVRIIQKDPLNNGQISRNLYQQAYERLKDNLEGNGSFKESVFLTESVFFADKLPVADLRSLIEGLALLCKEWKRASRLKDYPYKDSDDLLNNLAIYTVLKDTIETFDKDGQKYYHLPLSYDFNDFFRREQWANMFVSKLLISQRGNCHSLPYLYKILADELDATCWLSLAPNHMYIKNRSKKIGWYNTELTSGDCRIDAWITTSGYIPIKAIQNGIYMDTLSNRQAIALCVLDLAKGYEFQAKNYEDGFILKCCDLVLQHHPVNVQALLLKAETLKRLYERQTAQKSDTAKATYNEIEQLYIKLLDLGYREMPEKMYMQWLLSVNEQKGKYSNKQLKATLGGSHK
ncbi:MAG: hypothetical protein ACK4E0_03180 [Chitinophagaceae bacterium]